MSKNYQRRENYNSQEMPVDVTADALSLDDATDAVNITLATEIVDTTPTPVYIPTHITAPTPPTVTPVPQLQKVVMLPVQSELTALAQAINPKQPVQARWQYTLFQLLKSVLENEDNSEFHQQWSAVLNFYHAAKGTAFSDMYMLRFSDDWPGSDLEFSLFRRLVHIVSQTSEPQSRRKSALMINFSRATEGLQEDAGNRLIGFYA